MNTAYNPYNPNAPLLVIYGTNTAACNKWINNHTYTSVRPTLASPETPDVFRGMRDGTVICIDTTPMSDELRIASHHNHVICL